MSGASTVTKGTGAARGASEGRAIHRFEVRAKMDPRGEVVRREAAHVGVHPTRVRTARVYLVAGAFTETDAARIGSALLADPVLEMWTAGALPVDECEQLIEVHPLPGVMDPAAQTVRESVAELVGESKDTIEVVTGWRYDVAGVSVAEADALARGLLANEVIEAVHREAWWPSEFPHAAPADQRLRHVAIRGLDDAALERLSREGHLFLSLEEMKAIRGEYERRGREPTDVELETLAQTWSEHCVHKTLKSDVRIVPPADDIIDWSNRPGHEVMPDGSVVIRNLLKSTVAAATFELIEEGCDWALSVFVDNAGVIAFDDEHAVCVKVETHNHPSAIEPYGGAATGIGGVIRDIMGTGLGAKPVACTDVFCVAYPDRWEGGIEGARDRGTKGEGDKKTLPAGCLDPRRVLTRVVDGVRDYGNRMGIPTVNGTVWFDDRFVGNPLVFAGCVGVMPRGMIEGAARAGDVIVAIGGRTGRDGIHGATFSSAELTDTHADEFSHAVQIGNAIEEKRVLDAMLRARDYGGGEGGCLYSAVTDCGAGGFSSAVGEMGEKIGAEVHLDRAPLKYAGLRYDEIWISESQERMVLAVARENLAALRRICDEERVEMAELGTFGVRGEDGGAELVLRFEGVEVGRMGMAFLHDGLPRGVREARWEGKGSRDQGIEGSRGREGSGSDRARAADIDVKATLLDLLAHPNIASKRWIVRQYDHEVQGGTAVKPLVGPGAPPIGPGDAAVIQPVPGSKKGLAIACGLAIPVGDPARGGDPYLMALAAVDECVRNLVCVGADPDRIAILDNFCWPSCAKPENLGALVRAAEGCYDAAKAYKTPFISGKDSLNNQFRTESGEVIEIPPTLLITGVGVVEDVEKCVTMDLKAGAELVLLAPPSSDHTLTRASEILTHGPGVARGVHEMIRHGMVVAAHDCSEGGIGVAVAEMLIASQARSARIVSNARPWFGAGERGAATDARSYLFGEAPCRVLLQLGTSPENPKGHLADAERILKRHGVRAWLVGDSPSAAPCDEGMHLLDEEKRIESASLRSAFLGSLDW